MLQLHPETLKQDLFDITGEHLLPQESHIIFQAEEHTAKMVQQVHCCKVKIHQILNQMLKLNLASTIEYTYKTSTNVSKHCNCFIIYSAFKKHEPM